MTTGNKNSLPRATLGAVRNLHEDAWGLAQFALAAPEFVEVGDGLSLAVHSLARWETTIAGKSVGITAIRQGIEPVTNIDEETTGITVRWGQGTQVARYRQDSRGRFASTNVSLQWVATLWFRRAGF